MTANRNRCYGYDENGNLFDCPNEPGTPWTPYWCEECDGRRKAGISRNLADLRAGLEDGS